MVWDVAVVGAGSAGCALAARLSEDGRRQVVLLEAGGDGRRDPRIAVPSLFVGLHRSRRDWGFTTEPQARLGGRRLHWPRGKALGGSSAISIVDHGRRPARPAFSLGVIGLRPRSRGRVALRALDPAVAPTIDPAYLTDPAGEDLRALRFGVGLARRIADAPALAAVRGPEREPGGDGRERADDGGALDGWIVRRAQTSYHPTGTCRMGTDAGAVVDPRLRVRGVAGLRVADASVMPQIPAANTNAACLMIGERAADLLREDL